MKFPILHMTKTIVSRPFIITLSLLTTLALAATLWVSQPTHEAEAAGPACYDYTGSTISGIRGSGDGELNTPKGLAVDSSDNVYIAETGNSRIQKFDSNGNFLAKWGTPGAGDGQFFNPFGLTFDSSDRLYVADRNNNRVQVFDTNGTFLEKWSVPFPSEIAIAPSGDLYVTSQYSPVQVSKFDSNKNLLTTWPITSQPLSVAVDGNGDVYVTVSGDHKVQKFDSNGILITQWGTPGGAQGFDAPAGVVIDQAGDVLVADQFAHRVHKFDSNGVFISTFGTFGTNPGELRVPFAMDFDSSNNVWVLNSNGDVANQFFSCPPPPPVDDDGDGIEDIIDTIVGFSNDFDDRPEGGTTFGTILDRGSLFVEVLDDPANGVTITASGTGGPAIIDTCGGFFIFLNPGESVPVDCG